MGRTSGARVLGTVFNKKYSFSVNSKLIKSLRGSLMTWKWFLGTFFLVFTKKSSRNHSFTRRGPILNTLWVPWAQKHLQSELYANKSCINDRNSLDIININAGNCSFMAVLMHFITIYYKKKKPQNCWRKERKT